MDVVDSVGGNSFEIHEDAPRKSGACVMAQEADIEEHGGESRAVSRWARSETACH